MADKTKKNLQAEAVERSGTDAAAALEGTPGMFPGDAATFGARASFASLPSQAVAPQPAASPSPAPAMPYQGMSAWDDPALARILATPVPGADYNTQGTPEPGWRQILSQWLFGQ